MHDTQNKKILSLESLRGIAAITVAISHFEVDSHLHIGFIDSAWLMVDFFFVLSGFVIALNYQHKLISWGDLYFFQVRRFFRLYPLHFFMLFIFLCIECSKYLAAHLFDLHANSPAFSRNNIYTFVSNLFLAQNLFDEGLSWNRPSWSVSAEFYTYILYAFFILMIGRKNILVIAASIFISAITFYLLIGVGMQSVGTAGLVRCIYSFFLGVACYNFYDLIKIRVISIYSYIFLTLSIVAIIFNKGYTATSSLLIPIIFMVTVFVLVSSPQKSILNRMLNNNCLVYLGTISYGIYMIHLAVWWSFNQIARVVFQFPTELDVLGRSIIVFENVFIADAVVLFGLLLIIYLAHLSYHTIEMPMNAFRKKFERQGQ